MAQPGSTPALGAGDPTPETAVSSKRTQITETNSTPASTSDPIRRSEHPISDDLRAVVDAWPMLPDAVRAGIVAMVKAASAGTER